MANYVPSDTERLQTMRSAASALELTASALELTASDLRSSNRELSLAVSRLTSRPKTKKKKTAVDPQQTSRPWRSTAEGFAFPCSTAPADVDQWIEVRRQLLGGGLVTYRTSKSGIPGENSRFLVTRARLVPEIPRGPLSDALRANSEAPKSIAFTKA
jgi:hypothetical protein